MAATKAKSINIDAIPAKKYLTIGEVSRFTGIKDHVLRYWEQNFIQLTPSKRSGRRYYQRDDVLLIIEISRLLNEEGLTIAGAQNRLSKQQKMKTESVLITPPVQQDIAELDSTETPQIELSKLQQALQISEVLRQQLTAFQKHLKENY